MYANAQETYVENKYVHTVSMSKCKHVFLKYRPYIEDDEYTNG